MRRHLTCWLAVAVVAVRGPAFAADPLESEWAPYVDPQRGPDDSEWVDPIVTFPTPPPPVSPPPDAPRSPLAPARSGFARRSRVPEPPNRISMAGAPTLGTGVRGELLSLGFPLFSLRFSIGVVPWLDLGLGFDSMYLLSNEPMLTARWGVVRARHWALALSVSGGYAFFLSRAAREARGGPRWLTGRRNINLSGALVASYQGPRPRDARLLLELRYLLALDTEPFATVPLEGVPPGVVLGHNLGLKGGAELPLSSTTSFLVVLGLEVHARPEDSRVMPSVSLGLVTSF